MFCPRRIEDGAMPGSPFWQHSHALGLNPKDPDKYKEEDSTCTYCGSLSSDMFMSRLEEGTLELGATDKNYKVYVRGEGLKQHYRNCPADAPPHMPQECAHWVIKDVNYGKFYFQHLSEAQQLRFIELMNEKKLKFEGGQAFYALPFFVGLKGYTGVRGSAHLPIVYCLRGKELA